MNKTNKHTKKETEKKNVFLLLTCQQNFKNRDVNGHFTKTKMQLK